MQFMGTILHSKVMSKDRICFSLKSYQFHKVNFIGMCIIVFCPTDFSSRCPRRAWPCFPYNNTIFIRDSSTFWMVSLTLCSSLLWSHWWIEKDSHIEPRTRSFWSRRRDGNFSCHEQYPSPRFERLCHKLPKILPSSLFWCKQCTGSAVYTIIMLTVMKPRVLLQLRWVKVSVWNRIGRTCMWKKWRIRSRLCGQDTMLVFFAKLMQVDMWLHEFPSIILKSGGRLRGCTGSRLRACTGVSDCSVWWTYKIFFVYVLKVTVISICDLHLLSMWPCSDCFIGESFALLLQSHVEFKAEGDAGVCEFSGPLNYNTC